MTKKYYLRQKLSTRNNIAMDRQKKLPQKKYY